MINRDNLSDPALIALANRILEDTGFDIRQYKERPLKRRLGVRMRSCRVATYEEYSQVLRSDSGEYPKLFDTLTINVTRFYRNPEAYAAVAAQVFPIIAKERAASGSCLFWSAGCSSGEEPYSISILWQEYRARHQLPLTAKIEATDIDRVSLERAQKGLYEYSSLEEMPPDLVPRYFTQPGGGYQVVPEIQRMVHFQSAELLDPAPFSGVDMIFCRNALIYFNRQSQDAIFRHFLDALRMGGFLVLGKVETLIGTIKDQFQIFDVKERIYRRAR